MGLIPARSESVGHRLNKNPALPGAGIPLLKVSIICAIAKHAVKKNKK